MDPDSPPTAVIAEDEPLLAAELRRGLAALWPQLHIAADVRDGAQALLAIEELRPQVAFLDIRMPLLSGLEVAQRVAGRCHVAFLSAYDQHAIAAFEAGGVDYVLKPLSTARLAVTVERLKSRIAVVPGALERALQQLADSAPARQKHHLQWINASRGKAVQIITVDEVLYFRADAKYTLVVTAQGEAVIRKTLKELGDELDPTSFWQVHRSAIVNVHAIDLVRRDGRGHMQLRLKGRADTLPVATQYQALFRQM